MIHVWDLIKQFMMETERANNMVWAESAWQRAKQLEADIQKRDNESDAEHRELMTRAREDADRVGAARIEFEDQRQKQIKALEASLLNHAGLVSDAEVIIIQQQKRIDALEADVKQGIFPGWQSYEDWVANERQIPKEWGEEYGDQ